MQYNLSIYSLGNAVRKAFSKPVTLSHILDFPVDLIRDFWTLLSCLTIGVDVSPTKFQELADSWLDRFHGNSFLNWNTLVSIISYFDSKSPSRHKQDFLEGIAPLRLWYIIPNEKSDILTESNKYKSSLLS